jgi:glutamyl-tRNA synthetase
MIRTRFAPSPTGYLHIGGARTALYAWAFARKHGGKFILRIEDTDQERSTDESVQTILDSMKWLGLHWDEGPVFQMQRLERYREVAEELIAKGQAYWCYASPDELTQMREQQRARGEKPRYDGRWRPEVARNCSPPEGVTPVLRFRNPDDGDVSWLDLVKGNITVSNRELDDFVLLRGDGTPTYNFGVVVDDHDMSLTHVIRGDDHVNNTPRQINVYKALGYVIPEFAHVPMILGHDGERLSKRHGAVSVTQYRDEGFISSAMVNYLARLGWSHGDDEVFTVDQLVEWFDLKNISRSPAKFDPAKLSWVNAEHLKLMDQAELVETIRVRLVEMGINAEMGPSLEGLISLLKVRAVSINELVDSAHVFYRRGEISAVDREKFLTQDIKPALTRFVRELRGVNWEPEGISGCIKETLKEFNLKMPHLAMPLRLFLTGQTQTPAIDALMCVYQREDLVNRIEESLEEI